MSPKRRPKGLRKSEKWQFGTRAVRIVDEGHVLGQICAQKFVSATSEGVEEEQSYACIVSSVQGRTHRKHGVAVTGANDGEIDELRNSYGRQLFEHTRYVHDSSSSQNGRFESWIVFPDFTVTPDKLGPVIWEKQEQGARTLEYTELKRLLGM